jgi:hypothetical protein
MALTGPLYGGLSVGLAAELPLGAAHHKSGKIGLVSDSVANLRGDVLGFIHLAVTALGKK